MRKVFLCTTILSLCFIFFAVYNIVAGQVRIQENLKHWEQTHPLDEPQREPKPESDSAKNARPTPASTSKPSNHPVFAPTPPTEETVSKIGDVIGKLIIPKLNRELPILEGTAAEQLAQGVGHYADSVMPGAPDNAVLAGHRDGVFTDLGELGLGDEVIVETATGTYTYEVTQGQIVGRDDRTIIVPHPDATLTLVTCYPFNFLGDAPQRYILTCKLKKSSVP